MSKVKVYDIETLSNCFTVTFCNVDDDDTWRFVIHDLWDNRTDLFTFLKSGFKHLGFNNLKFDYPVIHWMLQNEFKLMKVSADRAARMIYEHAQDLTRREDRGEWAAVAPWKVIIPQCDVYRVHHFDNKAKHASLKWIQIALKWRNVQDMPLHHTYEVKTRDEILMILDYNLNDVLSTRALYLYKQTRALIDMRKGLGIKYGISVLNANNPKVGAEIILKFIAEKKGVEVRDIKKLRTRRDSVVLQECILADIKFKPQGKFYKVHQSMLAKVLTGFDNETKLKNKFKMSAVFNGMDYKFGLGGLHGCLKSTIWRSDDEYDILSCDVTSYYPRLAVENKWYPEHMGPEFIYAYDRCFKERKLYAKKTPENEGLKLGLNGTFGKTNDINSPFYDPKFTMQITCNGQLLLALLCEELVLRGAGDILMANTDGIEVRVHKSKRALYEEICAAWEQKWRLQLEHQRYKVLATRDVNNYIGIFENGEVKCKGAYEVDKELHKDPSMRVVSLAVREAIVKDCPKEQKVQELERVIKSHTDMFDFMLAVRAKSDAWFELRSGHEFKKLSKTNRYVVSLQSGEYLFKVYRSGEIERVSGGYPVKLMNRINNETLEDLKLDYNYYIMEANKLLAPLINAQHELQF